MITFFRRIRQKIANDNQFFRYSRYAIGEIVLVVIGILIALQINNWNESRKQSISEKEFITNIKRDLKRDRDYIDLVIDLLKPKIEAYNILNSDLPNLYDNDRNLLDSIIQVYFRGQRTFYPIISSYQSALSGNQINTFTEKELIQSITKIYNSTYARLIENGQILDEKWFFLSKKYSYERRTGHFREMRPEQLSEFLDDLSYHYLQLEWYMNQLKSTKLEIDEIIMEK